MIKYCNNKNLCIDCGKEICNVSIRCKNCSNKTRKGKYTNETKIKIALGHKNKVMKTKKILLKSDIKNIKSLYVNKFKTYKKIAHIFRCSQSLIRKVLQELNIDTSLGYRKKILFKEKKLVSYLKGKTKTNYMPLRISAKKQSITKKQMFKDGKLPRFIGLRGENILAKQRWQNPTYRERCIKSILKGLIKRPTSFEQKIIYLCSKHKLPFIYTGDGRILINYKNPDFIDEKNKVIIEVFLNYFKERDYGSIENYIKVRGDTFAKKGYTTIFIREEEITNKNWENICLNKINNFSLQQENILKLNIPEKVGK